MTRVRHTADYAAKRRAEYPQVGDQLDQVWKVIEALKSRGTQLPAEADAMLGSIQATKARYPKPPIT